MNKNAEDLVKVAQKGKKKKGANAAGAGGGGGGGGGGANKNSLKVAKQVGKGKASRAALANKKRGLNESGKASQGDIDKAVHAQVKKVANKIKKTGAAAAATNKKQHQQPKTGTMSITFDSSKLSITTDKAMASQIRGVLSKTSRGGGQKQGMLKYTHTHPYTYTQNKQSRSPLLPR